MQRRHLFKILGTTAGGLALATTLEPVRRFWQGWRPDEGSRRDAPLRFDRDLTLVRFGRFYGLGRQEQWRMRVDDWEALLVHIRRVMDAYALGQVISLAQLDGRLG